MIKPELISFIARGKRRLEILKLLYIKQRSQVELMKLTKMYKSHTSRTLKELLDNKLIVCTNPKDREFKFYKINLEGKKSLEEIKKIH